jgi:hypothetical protein
MRLRSTLAVLAVLVATPAVAEVTTFARVSGWEAFGGTANDGKAVCGVSVEADGSYFSLKYFKGDKDLTVQLSDSDWAGKPGDKVSLGMQFDNRQPWRAQATAFKLGKDMALQFNVSVDQVDDWMDDFKESYKLFIVFANSDVPSWKADLTGTKAIGEAMEDCVDAITKHR